MTAAQALKQYKEIKTSILRQLDKAREGFNSEDEGEHFKEDFYCDTTGDRVFGIDEHGILVDDGVETQQIPPDAFTLADLISILEEVEKAGDK